jgi:predicted esterase
MIEHHIATTRTARYFTLGTAGEHIRQVWFVLHGYGYLAERFLRDFRQLDDGTRLIVAPEALSRFYVAEEKGHIGASWMTKEDRLVEIDDYIRYLDAVAQEVMKDLDTGKIEIIVLGFSQGTATGGRWAVNGSFDVDALILWGGMMPPEINLANEKLGRLSLTLVLGRSDEYADAERTAAERNRLAEAGIEYRWVEYDGGHRIDLAVVNELADTCIPRSA